MSSDESRDSKLFIPSEPKNTSDEDGNMWANYVNYKPPYIFFWWAGSSCILWERARSFLLFFTNELAHFIINKTNHQGTTLKLEASSGESRASVWENVTREEFFMGIVKSHPSLIIRHRGAHFPNSFLFSCNSQESVSIYTDITSHWK